MLFLLIHTTFCLLIFVVSLRRYVILLFMLFCSYHGLRSRAILLFMLLGIVMVLEMKLCYFVYDILYIGSVLVCY